MSHILIFSDTHLTSRFNQKKFNYLKKIIEKAEQVFIVGDFWDAYFTSFDSFLNSKWKDLFPLLKDRKCIYLYGNHDTAKDVDQRASIFSDFVGKSYQFKYGGKEFLLDHGDEIADTFTVDPKHPLINKIIKRGSIAIVWGQKILVTILGIKAFRALWGLQRQNKLLIDNANRSDNPGLIKIHGHTHIPLFMLEKDLIILGGIRLGSANYITVEDTGEIKVVEERY